LRIWILSDLHRDVGVPWSPASIPVTDVAVIAGDVGEGIEGSLSWLARAIRPHMRVVFVAGNHEHYRGCMPDELARGRSVAASLGIDFLEDEATWIDGVAFAGCTLWTDYRLDGDRCVASAMDDARHMLNDHRLIDRERRPRRLPFRPEDAAATHLASRAWLESLARMPAWTQARGRVVVTHHGPTAASLDPAFAGAKLNPAFASQLDGLVAQLGCDLWVHGHVHASRAYRVGATRVLCNPKGYHAENGGFDPALVVALPA